MQRIKIKTELDPKNHSSKEEGLYILEPNRRDHRPAKGWIKKHSPQGGWLCKPCNQRKRLISSLFRFNKVKPQQGNFALDPLGLCGVLQGTRGREHLQCHAQPVGDAMGQPPPITSP